MIPAIVTEAEQLVAHASRLGGPLRLMELIVTKAQGFELIAWLVDQNLSNEQIDTEALLRDVEIAKAQDDPFVVLDHFTILGLSMRKPLVH